MSTTREARLHPSSAAASPVFVHGMQNARSGVAFRPRRQLEDAAPVAWRVLRGGCSWPASLPVEEDSR